MPLFSSDIRPNILDFSKKPARRKMRAHSRTLVNAPPAPPFSAAFGPVDLSSRFLVVEVGGHLTVITIISYDLINRYLTFKTLAASSAAGTWLFTLFMIQ
jgi:hypothetical protein